MLSCSVIIIFRIKMGIDPFFHLGVFRLNHEICHKKIQAHTVHFFWSVETLKWHRVNKCLVTMKFQSSVFLWFIEQLSLHLTMMNTHEVVTESEMTSTQDQMLFKPHSCDIVGAVSQTGSNQS